MDRHDWLVERFDANRPRLRAVAYRMLGSLGDADEAVEEAWLSMSHADTSRVENLGGWLTTIVTRVCLDMRRSRRSPARGTRRRPRARSDRAPRELDRPSGRRGARRLSWPGVARGVGDADTSRTAGVRPARHVRPAFRPDRSHARALPDRDPAAGEPGTSPGARRSADTGSRCRAASVRWSTCSSTRPDVLAGVVMHDEVRDSPAHEPPLAVEDRRAGGTAGRLVRWLPRARRHCAASPPRGAQINDQREVGAGYATVTVRRRRGSSGCPRDRRRRPAGIRPRCAPLLGGHRRPRSRRARRRGR